MNNPSRYLPLVESIARRLSKRLPSHIDARELVSSGVVGLLEAMQQYDHTSGTPFEKFAEFRIRGEMIDDLRQFDTVSRDYRTRLRHYEHVVYALRSELGRAPESEEVAKRMGITCEELRVMLPKMRSHEFALFIEGVYSSDDPNAFDSACHSQMVGLMMDAMGQLNEKQTAVMKMYYGDGMTLSGIGRAMELSHSRISQILKGSKNKLKKFINKARRLENG